MNVKLKRCLYYIYIHTTQNTIRFRFHIFSNRQSYSPFKNPAIPSRSFREQSEQERILARILQTIKTEKSTCCLLTSRRWYFRIEDLLLDLRFLLIDRRTVLDHRRQRWNRPIATEEAVSLEWHAGENRSARFLIDRKKGRWDTVSRLNNDWK